MVATMMTLVLIGESLVLGGYGLSQYGIEERECETLAINGLFGGASEMVRLFSDARLPRIAA